MLLLRVESYEAGVLVRSRTVPNWIVAKNVGRAEVRKGRHVLVMFPRGEGARWS